MTILYSIVWLVFWLLQCTVNILVSFCTFISNIQCLSMQLLDQRIHAVKFWWLLPMLKWQILSTPTQKGIPVHIFTRSWMPISLHSHQHFIFSSSISKKIYSLMVYFAFFKLWIRLSIFSHVYWPFEFLFLYPVCLYPLPIFS